jgi:signal transduction histidine kinase
MVHDMNQPLHVLKFCFEEIRRNPEQLGNPEFQNQIELNLNRIHSMTDSFRHYIRGDSTAKTGSPFRESYHDVMQLVRTQFKPTELSRIRFDFDADFADVRVDVNGPDLIHILDNLIRNAVQSVLRGGEAGVQARVAVTRLAARDGYVGVAVDDTGEGLSSEDFRALVEEPANFFYVQQRKQGLGMRLVLRLVTRLGGTLEISKDPPEGVATRFVLTLPARGDKKRSHPELLMTPPL